MEPLTLDDPVVIDGYDLAGEHSRLRFPDITLGDRTLNRSTARIEVSGGEESEHVGGAREDHAARLFVTTHDASSQVLQLGFPCVGPYVSSEAGVYMDLMCACAQKLLDENHPLFRRAVRRLLQHGLIMRREINTDDYLVASPMAEGVRTPQDLAALLSKVTRARFVDPTGWKSFFCNSGTEAVEAAIKLATLVRWRRLQQNVGASVIEKLMAQLGIPRDAFARDPNGEDLWSDYPLFVVATEGAFHGRSLGSLNLTRSLRIHQVGFPKLRWMRHIPYNGPADSLERVLDPRPLAEIVDSPGGVQAVLDAGRIPQDLCAAFIAEGFQGEGGYVPGSPEFFVGVAATCRQHGILVVADEVQSLGRTGKLYAFEHLGVAPDVIVMAKAAFLGVMLARADLEQHLQPGWHSNTYGGGKIFDVNMSYATFEALVEYEEPTFGGLRYLENLAIKGQYLCRLLERIQKRHPDTLCGIDGRGGMIGLSLRRRDEVIATAWRRGLKLLGCGLPGEVERVRVLLLADVLTREVDEIATTLDAVLTEVEAG